MAEKRRMSPQQFQEYNAQLSATPKKMGDPYGAGEEGQPEEGYYKEASHLTDNPILNFFIGGAKRGGQYALNLGGAVRNNPAYTFGLLHRMGMEKDPLSDIAQAGRPEDTPRKPFSLFNAEGHKAMQLTPKGTAQELGAGAFDIGTSFVPGGSISRGVAAAPNILRATSPALRKGIEMAARTGSEAALAGTQAALSGEDPTSAAALTAPFSVFGGLVSDQAKKLAPKFKNWAYDTYSQIFQPSTRDQKVRAWRMTKQIVDEGLPGAAGNERGIVRSRAQMGKMAKKEMYNRLMEREQLIAQQYGGQEALSYGLNDLVEATAQLRGRGLTATSRRRGRPTYTTKFTEQAGADLDDLLARVRDQAVPNPVTGEMEIPFVALDKFKSDYQDYLKKIGRFDSKTGAMIVNDHQARAQEIMESAIRKIIFDRTPDIAKLNKTISFWKSIDEAMEAHRLKLFGRGSTGQSRPVVGGAQGDMLHRLGRYQEYRIALNALQKVTKSAAWLSTSADAKRVIANSLAKGDTERVIRLLGRMTAIGGREDQPMGAEPPLEQWTPEGVVPKEEELGEDKTPIYRVTSWAKKPD